MLAIISLLIVVTVSILITRVATIALTHTGLSRESSRFQARSAFTGAGFTTYESENVVAHPVRRRIVMLLMLLGNAGIVTAVSSLMLTFVGKERSGSLVLKVVVLASGLAVLWTFASSRFVDRHLSRLIDRALRRFTSLDVQDYSSLMHLAGDYRLFELRVEERDWVAGKTLAESRLRDEGLVVLGIRRPDDTYLGAPGGATAVESGDVLLLYGKTRAVEALDQRRRGRSGDREHRAAIQRQEETEREEAAQDPRAAAAGRPASGTPAVDEEWGMGEKKKPPEEVPPPEPGPEPDDPGRPNTPQEVTPPKAPETDLPDSAPRPDPDPGRPEKPQRPKRG